MCEIPNCESKAEDIRYLQHWICMRHWDYYADQKVQRMGKLKRVLQIEEKKDKTLEEYAVW